MDKKWLGWTLVLAVAGCGADKDGISVVLDGSISGASADAAEDPAADAGDSTSSDAGTASGDTNASSDGGGSAPDSDASSSADAGSDAGTSTDAATPGSPPEPDAAMDSSTATGDSGASGDASSGSDASSSADASNADAEVTRDQYCSGRGSVIKVPGASAGTTRDVCTGTVARQRFKNALCTCEDLDLKGYLNTGSFSASKDAPGTFTKSGGSVGVNGSVGWLISAGDFDIGGSLRLWEGATYGGYVHVYGDFESNGNVNIAGYLDVTRDAKMHEGILLPGHANIGRNSYTPPGTFDLPGWAFIGGEEIVQDFTLEKPCDCEPQNLLDIDAIVRDGKLKNDNANPAVNLSADVLTGLDFARRVELPCGRFYLDEISGVGDVHLVINGRTALFIGGDVKTVGHFDIELGPQGELDLFIAGDLAQVGYGQFGDVNRPSGVRVYVGGDGDIFFRGYQPFGANLYAPRSHLHSDGFIDAKGSIFVRSLYDNGYLKVAYDRDVLDLGDDDSCNPPPPPPPPPVEPPPVEPPPPPPPQCDSVCDESCGQQTCRNGMCLGCRTDADCCSPLVCYPDGRCGPLLF
jgi:hypothetical protein